MVPIFARMQRALVLTALVAVLGLLAGCGSGAEAIGVNALSADPMAFTGTITVKGVVQDVDAAASRVMIIDEEEYASCGLTPCAGTGIIPLHVPLGGEPSSAGSLYSGSLPDIEDTVLVTGEVKSMGQGLVFDVDRIERGSSTLVSRQ